MSVYILLLHGRDDPNEDMKDWGFHGPTLGPFAAVHFTYKEHIRCIADSAREEEIELGFCDDLLAYQGKYYGDFEIVSDIEPDAPANPKEDPNIKIAYNRRQTTYSRKETRTCRKIKNSHPTKLLSLKITPRMARKKASGLK